MEKKKKRRINDMEEARKESKAEEIKEKPAKEEKKELKVRDYTDITRELIGLVKENYITGLQLGLSLWDGNLKIISTQIEQWVSVQEGYVAVMRDLLGKLPNEAVNFWDGNLKFINNPLENMVSLQKDYSSAVTNTSDRFMKEAITLMRNGIERVFSSFNDYMNLIRG